MAYTARDHDTIVASLIEGVATKIPAITNFSEGSVIRALVDVMADEIENLEGYIEALYNAITLEGMSEEELDAVASIFHITRGVGQKATGVVRFFTGDSPATSNITIPSGYTVESVYVDDENYEFETTTEATIEVGELYVDVPIIAKEYGYIKVPVGNINELTDSLVGVNSVSNLSSVVGGQDPETNDSLVDRIRNAKSGSCSVSATRDKLMSVDNVVGANYSGSWGANNWVLRLAEGYTAITDLPQASQDEIDNVITYSTPCGATNSVSVAGAVTEDIRFVTNNSFNPTTEQQEKIWSILQQYCDSVGIGGTIIIRQLEARVLAYILQFDINGSVTCYISGANTDYTIATNKYLDIKNSDVYINDVPIIV